MLARRVLVRVSVTVVYVFGGGTQLTVLGKWLSQLSQPVPPSAVLGKSVFSLWGLLPLCPPSLRTDPHLSPWGLGRQIGLGVTGRKDPQQQEQPSPESDRDRKEGGELLWLHTGTLRLHMGQLGRVTRKSDVEQLLGGCLLSRG